MDESGRSRGLLDVFVFCQTPKQNALNMYVTSCMKLNDAACTSAAFEKLVAQRPHAPLHAVVKYKGGDDGNPARKALEAEVRKLMDSKGAQAQMDLLGSMS